MAEQRLGESARRANTEMMLSEDASMDTEVQRAEIQLRKTCILAEAPWPGTLRSHPKGKKGRPRRSSGLHILQHFYIWWSSWKITSIKRSGMNIKTKETAILPLVAYHLDKDQALKIKKHSNLTLTQGLEASCDILSKQSRNRFRQSATFFSRTIQRHMGIFW